ncbi:MAG: hypothetical protein QOE03_847, partial [Micromonosporaceae bacterium]|nr:hypothetical protein [Micromonosporaceae bacterium]
MTISTRGVRGRGGPSHRRRLPRLFRTADWRVRTKLAAALTIPAVAFVMVVGVGVVSSVRQAESLQLFTRQVHLSRQVTALVHELQRERDRTAGVLAGVTVATDPAGPDATRVVAALAPDRAAVDRAAAALRQAARTVRTDPAVRAPYQQVDAALRQLDQVRAAVRDGWLRQDAVFAAYSRDIHALIALLPEESRVGAGGETLGHHINSLTTLAAAKELTDQVRGRLYALTIAGRLDATGVRALSDLGAQRATVLEQFSGSANPSELGALDEILHSPQIAGSEMLAQQAIGEALVGRLTIDPQKWWEISTGALELIRQAEKGLLDVVVSSADERSFTRWRGTLLAGGLALAILIGVLFTSWGIGRSLARSLRLLREQALDVAARRLPEAIERLRTNARGDPVNDVAGTSIDTADEIGQVAQAFTAVHRTAVRLAVEQAMMRRGVNAMFVNLARRSQTLVERQLQLLDNLESSETDPDQLSSLFRLDHLATRMRRNDENLLVLAGADNSRRWTEPVALSAVVLAAVAEIEQYPRIRHDVTDEIHIVGHAVADVVHLLAELLENATTFSPPDTPVTVTGWRAGDGGDTGEDGGATILIADSGLGMSAASVVEANQQLATPSSIDVATSERMGLLVVANLAARQQITVELGGTERGVQAQVSLPARILAPPPLHDVNGPFGIRTLPPSDHVPGDVPGARRDTAAIAVAGTAPAPLVGATGRAIGAASVVGVATAPTITPAPAVVVGAAPAAG